MKKNIFINVIKWSSILSLDFFIYLVLGVALMDYDDN